MPFNWVDLRLRVSHEDAFRCQLLQSFQSWLGWIISFKCTCALSCANHDPMDYRPLTPGSSVHGTSQARIPEWVVISYSRGSSWSRDRTLGSWGSCITTGFFTTEPPGKTSFKQEISVPPSLNLSIQFLLTWQLASPRANDLRKNKGSLQDYSHCGFPGGTGGKEPTCQCRSHKRCKFDLWVGKITATHSSILAWRIPWTEEPDGLQSIRL